MITIQLIARFSQSGDEIRVDLASLGDQSPEGWTPGTTETGPNYFAAATIPGTLPKTLPQSFVDDLGAAFRKAVRTRLPALTEAED